MLAESRELVEMVAEANRILTEAGLADGIRVNVGHVSARMPGTDYVIVKGRGYERDVLSEMRPEHMLVTDLDNQVVEGPEGITPPREIYLHTAVYRRRPDVACVVHAHPEYATLMSVVDVPLTVTHHEGVMAVVDGVDNYPDMAVIRTYELGEDMAAVMGSKNTLLLRGHGAVSAGVSVEDAMAMMIGLEDQAKRNYMALASAGPDFPRVPRDQILAYAATRARGTTPEAATAIWQYYEKRVRL